eukprot:CAMPEP_0115464736 /NCGR_PEP_ID=MMETSP0271-20121206/49034_1 /TAXON_ID=71861 /ORGANISM="Scrippsiella trochoidea, Strain CCMP3099" /LENGTH=484 /DNA_ID=CAMNT_0002891645 /DNA_START=24 /DNA_END=1478 /DNA_ORIENTATION=+
MAPTDVEQGSDRLDVAEGEASQFRFSQKEVAEFEGSSEGRGLLRCFFLLALFYMWPGQTMIQTQNFLVEEFPGNANEAPFVMMICATLPGCLTHAFLSFTGLSRRLSYTAKIVAPCLVVVLLAVYLFLVLSSSNDQDLLLRSLYCTALLCSMAGSIVEPAVNDIAGLLPSTSTSQMAQAGTGATGVIVSGVQILTRLTTSGKGPIDKDGLQRLTRGFIVFMGVIGLAIIAVYLLRVRRSLYYATYVKRQPTATGLDAAGGNGSDGADADGSNGQSEGEGDRSCRALFRATLQASRYVWPSCLAMVLTYGTTLTLWPVIPGRSCAATRSSSDGPSTLQSWWFDTIILCFNLGDYLGKSAQKSLAWGSKRFSPKAQLLMAALRTVFFAPLILTASAPQLYPAEIARWVTLLSVFALGLSNGWLSTVCLMRAPKALPPGTSNMVAEQATSLVLVGLMLGISTGCMLAYELGQTVLVHSLGVCYGAAS